MGKGSNRMKEQMAMMGLVRTEIKRGKRKHWRDERKKETENRKNGDNTNIFLSTSKVHTTGPVRIETQRNRGMLYAVIMKYCTHELKLIHFILSNYFIVVFIYLCTRLDSFIYFVYFISNIVIYLVVLFIFIWNPSSSFGSNKEIKLKRQKEMKAKKRQWQ